jgi:hypothetical protein
MNTDIFLYIMPSFSYKKGAVEAMNTLFAQSNNNLILKENREPLMHFFRGKRRYLRPANAHTIARCWSNKGLFYQYRIPK